MVDMPRNTTKPWMVCEMGSKWLYICNLGRCCFTLILSKLMEKKLDGNYAGLLCAIFNES